MAGGVRAVWLGVSLLLVCFFAAHTEANWDRHIVPHDSSSAETVSGPLRCSRSNEIALMHDKAKRGPFSDERQMERVKMMNAMFESVKNALQQEGLCFWAERKTLLAAYRLGVTFPDAKALHLGILSSDYEKVAAILPVLELPLGAFVNIETDAERGLISVHATKADLEAVVRIHAYAPDEQGRLSNSASVFRPAGDIVFPLKRALFNGEYLWVPARSDIYLKGQYGPSFAKVQKNIDWATMSYTKDAEEHYPLVSVIIPTYGRPEFLKKSIELIRRQDYPNIEVVIVDDSPSATPEVAQESWVRYYHLSSRKSIGEKRNLATEKTKGSIIVHWDDDDYFREHRITQQVAPIIRGDSQMTVLEHHLYLHLPSKSFYHVKRASTWGPHFATFVYSRLLWEAGIRYPDNSMAEDYAFAEIALNKGFTIRVMNNEDGKHIYVRHRNTWEFDLEDYASQVQKVDRPDFFSAEDEAFFLNVESKPLPKPPRHYASREMKWDRPELKPGWSTGEALLYPPYYPHYPPYYPKYPKYDDESDVFDATWIFVGIIGGGPIVLGVVLGGYYYYQQKRRNDYLLLDGAGLNSVA